MANGQNADTIGVGLAIFDENFRAGIQRASSAMGSFASFVFSWRGLITGATAALIISFTRLGRTAVAAAASIDAALREVATLLPQTRAQLDGLRSTIIDLSTAVPQTPEILTAAFYQIVSAGITDTAEAFEVLRVSSQAAVGGLTDTETAADAITTVLNAFQLNAGEAGRVADVFFETIRAGKLRFGDIASSIGTVATSAALAGLSIEEVGAALATLTKFGIDAAEAATSLNRLFLTIIRSTDQQQAAAKALGIEWNAQALATKGLAGFMQDLNEKTGGNIEVLAQIVPQIRAAKSAFILAGEGTSEFVNILADVETGAGAANRAFTEMIGSMQAQSTLLKQRVNALFAEFGEKILPNVISLLRTFNQILESDIDTQIRLLRELGLASEALRLERELLGQRQEENIEALARQLDRDINRLQQFASVLAARFADPVGLADIFQVGAKGFGGEIQAAADAMEEAAKAGDKIAFTKAVTQAREMVRELEKAGTSAEFLQVRILEFATAIERAVADFRQIEEAQAALALVTDSRFLSLQRQLDLEGEILGSLERGTEVSEDDIKAQKIKVKLIENELNLRRRISDIDIVRTRTSVAGAVEAQEALNKSRRDGRQLIDAIAKLEGTAFTEQIALLQERLGANKILQDDLAGQISLERALVQLSRDRQGLESGRLPGKDLPFIPDTAAIDAARRRIEAIRKELKTISEFGFTNLDQIPEGLRGTLEALIEVRAEIEQLDADIKLTAGDTALLEARLDDLRATEARLLEQAGEIILTPEGQIAADALTAKENVEELVAVRKLLGAVGFGGEIPAQFLAAAEAIGETDIQIIELNADLETLRLARDEAVRKADELMAAEEEVAEAHLDTARALDILIESGEEAVRNFEDQRRAQLDTIKSLAGLEEIFEVFEGLKPEQFAGFTPEEIDTFRGELTQLGALQEERLKLEGELLTRTFDTQKARRQVEERITKLVKEQKELLKKIGEAFRDLSDEDLAKLGEIFKILLEVITGARVQFELGFNLQTIEGIARGVLSIADAFGDVDDSVRRALTGIIDIAAGIGRISTDPIGGITQAIGGFIGVLGGLFGGGGPTPEQVRLEERLDKLVEALDRLRNDLRFLRSAFSQLTGDTINAFREVASSLGFLGGGFPVFASQASLFQESGGPEFIRAFLLELDKLGLSMDDLRQIADTLGIPIDTLLDALEDARAGRKIELTTEEIFALSAEINAFGKALQELDLAKALSSFTGQLDLLQRRFQLFDIDDPVKQLEELAKVFVQFSGLPAALKKEIESLDLSTAAGQARLKEILQFIFTQIESGAAGAIGLLGQLTLDEFLDAIAQLDSTLDAAIEDLPEGITKSFQVTRTITEVTGNRIVGTLITISIVNQSILAVVKEILIEMGGTVPENVQAISFRAPAADLDLIEIEKQQLVVLEAILVALGGTLITEGVVELGPESIPFVPDPGLADPPRLEPPTEAQFAAFTESQADRIVAAIDGLDQQVNLTFGDIVVNPPAGAVVSEATGDEVMEELDRRLFQRFQSESRLRGQ